MKNKKILIIGGTGALGKTLLKRYYDDNKVIVFSRDEHKHYHLLKEYKDIVSVIGDVKDKDSVMNVILQYNPHVVINTAALKHVPICEDNPYESVKTNIVGHQNVIECVNTYGKIETLMFISTDKACKPINVYGMCKATSERLYIDYSKKQKDTKVILCRYGNVLESTGSVIPFFKGLLDRGLKSLPITDRRMTRFLLSLDESVDLIDWAYNHPNSHSCIVVPKIKSFLVTDLAVELGKSYAGLDEVVLNYIGIRPGEKIHEEMVSLEESLRTVEYDNYYMITDDKISDDIWSLSSDDSLMDCDEINGFLKEKGVID